VTRDSRSVSFKTSQVSMSPLESLVRFLARLTLARLDSSLSLEDPTLAAR
jgi:hypothetical protein